MVPRLAGTVRSIFREERIPTRLLWWFAAEGMGEWYELVAAELGRELEDARSIVAGIATPMLRRRYDLLRAAHSGLPAGDRAVGLAMGVLYRASSNPAARWVLAELGGGPVTFADHLAAERMMLPVPVRARWEEVTCHLGDLLVALTERLPAHLPRARGWLGDLCFAAGVRCGKKMKKAFALEGTPAEALEVLRMSEYVFRVNPEHWGSTDQAGGTGWLEGTACPWFEGPGWNGAHCGIFGQFQSGISSVFGLRYHLTTTIPKHGGHTCRIDVKPIPLRRGAPGEERRT